METSERPRLDSWKEIARYLGRDITTVIRWGRDRGLPVHRLPGGKLPRVFAYPEELDQWLASRAASEARVADQPAQPEIDDGSPPRSVVRLQPDATSEQGSSEIGADARGAAAGQKRPRRFLPISIAAVAVVGVTLAALTLTREIDPPRRLVAVGRELHALDAAGRTRWVHRFDATGVAFDGLQYIADLDGDRRDDVLAAVMVTPPTSSEHVDPLLRFSADGTLQWSFTPEDRIRFREDEYGPPWASAYLRVFRVGGEPRIAYAVHHYTWWPGVLITLNARGERLATFVNSGWIGRVTQSPDGRHLFISGTTNLRGSYFFAVLDAARPSGHSPEPRGAPTECLTCPAGDPLRYLVFPRTDISRHQPFPHWPPSAQIYEDGTVFVRVLASEGLKIAETIYELGPDFEVRTARFSDSFWEWHRRLEDEGKLHHRAQDCPERRGLDVQSWTPDAGWQTQRVPVQ